VETRKDSEDLQILIAFAGGQLGRPAFPDAYDIVKFVR
jgi:hypothetical protein